MTASKTIYSWLWVPLAVELLLSRQRDEKETPFSINNSEPHKYCSSPTQSSFYGWSLFTGTKIPAAQSLLFLSTAERGNCPRMGWIMTHRGPERSQVVVLWWYLVILRYNLNHSAVIKCHLTWDHPSITLLHNVVVSFSWPAQEERFSNIRRCSSNLISLELYP